MRDTPRTLTTFPNMGSALDAGTAYEILSIDIADVDVGADIGAKLQIVQANADKEIAQAKAEQPAEAVGDKIGQGPARVIQSAADLEQMQHVEVLVTEMTDPDWEPVMKRAANADSQLQTMLAIVDLEKRLAQGVQETAAVGTQASR